MFTSKFFDHIYLWHIPCHITHGIRFLKRITKKMTHLIIGTVFMNAQFKTLQGNSINENIYIRHGTSIHPISFNGLSFVSMRPRFTRQSSSFVGMRPQSIRLIYGQSYSGI